MKHVSSGHKLWSGLFFRLLPYQVLLLIINAANGIVDTVFASNVIGQDAMTAIGLYSPLNHFLFALSIMLVSGSQLMVGKAMGRNEMDSVEDFFSTDLIVSVVLSVIVSVLLIAAALTNATRVFISDPAGLKALNGYLISNAFGIPGLVLGQQLFAFLSMENQRKLTMIASLVCFVVNTITDWLFLVVMKMGTFGLGLGTSVATWVFCIVMLRYYTTGKSEMKFSLRAFRLKDSFIIMKKGYSGAISRFVEMFRCVIVNALLLKFVGDIGISAFAAVNSVMAVFWPITFGMVAVTRMLLSITIGEEDRKSLADIMKIALVEGGILQCAVSTLIISLAVPFTQMFYHVPTEAVYTMTLMGFRLLPLCMPLAVLSLTYVCYAQAMDKRFLATVLPIVDGMVGVVVCSLILIPLLHMTGLYISNILNGFICLAILIWYVKKQTGKSPKSIEDILMIPDEFGVDESNRIDIEVKEVGAVNTVSEQVIGFCREHGIDRRRAYFAGLALEEMAGNVVEHGFTKDKKKHVVDMRVVHKKGDIILRILDNCRAFDPLERIKNVNEGDQFANVGIRLVTKISKDVQYQNLLGMNVLTMRI